VVFGELRPHLGPEITRRIPPHSAREMISELRAFLRKHGTYAYKPKGASMRPFVKSGDSLLIEATDGMPLAAGDVLLHWMPGRRPEEDSLTCQRIAGRAAGSGPQARGRRAQLLGKVSAVSRDGKTWQVPGRADDLGRRFGTEVALPILRRAGR
jgi:hypothetical protein